MTRAVPVALTIAGSDSGGGAGIQADLRTFSFHCVHGTSAITCVTAQNTVAVTQVEAISTAAVAAQIKAVVKDFDVQATKTGMLLNADIIEVVAKEIERWELGLLVVDPVMVSRAGAQLIDEAAIAQLRQVLLPKALIATPNRYEAQLLGGLEINTLDDMREAAQAIYHLGAAAVLVKGGAMPGELKGVDLWFDGERWETLRTVAVDTNNSHGTGCTLSAAIAANLALGASPLAAVKQAKHYVTKALQHSLAIGKGSGPVGHFFPLLNS